MDKSFEIENQDAPSIIKKSRPKLVPWRNFDEWAHVYRLLYSHSKLDQIEGLEWVGILIIAQYIQPNRVNIKVNMWRSRMALPVSIECTAYLLVSKHIDPYFDHEYDLEWQDTSQTEDTTDIYLQESSNSADLENRITDLSLRLHHTQALIRLVNDLCDPHQQSTHAQSILDISQNLEIPRFLVDLRHEGTHGLGVELPVLRQGLCEGLYWLDRQYWKVRYKHGDIYQTGKRKPGNSLLDHSKKRLRYFNVSIE